MQDRTKKNKPKSTKILRLPWFWILIGLVFFVVLFFIMLPVGIDYGIERYLKDQGADQATLADVDFNPFTGRITLTDLTVTIGTQTVLNIPKAAFKIQWTPFIRKRFVLKRFSISDTQLTIIKLEDGRWQIGGITLPDKSDSHEPSIWNFSFQEANISSSKVKFISPTLISDLTIEQAKISKLTSWMQADSAQLEFTGQLNDAQMQLQMDVSPFGNEIVASGRIQLKGLTLKPFARLLEPQLQTIEGRLDADLAFDTRQAPDSGFSHHQKGLLNLYPISARIEDREFTGEDLAWDGALRIDIPESEEVLKISAEGQLNGSKLALTMQSENIKIQQDNLNWKGKIGYAQDNSSENINAAGQIVLLDVKMEYPEINLAEKKLAWKGALQVSSTTKVDGQRIIADGALDGSHLRVSLLNRKLQFEHQGLSWKGRLNSEETNDLNSLKVEADATIKEIEIHHPESQQNLLKLERLDLEAIEVEGLGKINVADIAMNGLAMLADLNAAQTPPAERPPLRMQEVKIKNIQLSQQKDLAIDAINLKTVNAFVQRNAQGKWPALDRLDAIKSDVFSADQTDRAVSDTTAKEKSGEFGFRIGQLDITGNTVLRFEDESVDPTFNTDLNLLEARLSDLDSRQPEKPASVKLRASDGEQARLSLDGSIQPFAERLSLDWVAKIEALELPPLSPYVIQNTGYRFLNGEMQADIPLKINQNKLDGKIDLILYNPTVERVKAEDPERKKQGKIQIDMPLDSALKLLRDAQNNVNLNIPVRGDISDPQFSVADAVNKVLAKTLQTSALSYLKFMLGPYGIGLAVAEQAIKGTSKIRLNPILFAPGSAELDDTAMDYTQRVAAILKEHPAVQVSVCGVATESDRAAMGERTPETSAAQTDTPKTTDEALRILAKERSKSIEDLLVNAHGISAKRIIVCKPQIAKGADAQPRVDLKI